MAPNIQKDMNENWETDRNWQPLERANHFTNTDTVAAELACAQNISQEEALKILADYDKDCEYWVNNQYQVQVRFFRDANFAHLNIRRRDGKAIFRDWRHFQWIKNQLIGPECEAVELYPAESRMVDASNKYHLYCSLDPAFRFPFGMKERDVDYTQRGTVAGTKQRPLNK